MIITIKTIRQQSDGMIENMDANTSIVYYTDYRKFLRDYYASRKKSIPHFSYQVFAQLAGLSSASFIRMVMTGDKCLTKESAAGVAKAMRLNKKMTDYFTGIVFFSQAKDLKTKEAYLNKIDTFRKKNNPGYLRPKEYEYLKNWIHAVVREIVDIKEIGADPEKIAASFLFPVDIGDIRKSIAFLLEHGYIEKKANGMLVKREKTISTGDIPQTDEILVIAKKYHLQMLGMAASAMMDLSRDMRSITNTTLSFSRESYELAIKRIENLRYELLELAASEKNADRVCQLNVNLFPVVKKP